MMQNHNCANDRMLIEVHRRNSTASVMFVDEIIDIFDTYAKRQELVYAIGDEINSIPSDTIYYGAIEFKGVPAAFSSVWCSDEQRFIIDIFPSDGLTYACDEVLPADNCQPEPDKQEKDLLRH